MSKKLVIVESPNKVRSIAGYLGSDFDVEASVGHVRDLAQPSELPAAEKKGPYGKFAVDTEDGFKPYYVVNADKKKTVTQLRKALKEADELYLATDDDREGEAIAWHLQQVLKPKVPVRRMVFNEITKSAILEAAEKLSYSDAERGSSLFDATRDALEQLQDPEQHPTLVLDAFILRATEHAGWGLSLFNCANCGAPGPHKAFNAAVGGAVCNNCRPPGSLDVERETLHDMWLMQRGSPVSSQRAAQIHRATVAHLQFNLETGLKSLKIMEQA